MFLAQRSVILFGTMIKHRGPHLSVLNLLYLTHQWTSGYELKRNISGNNGPQIPGQIGQNPDIAGNDEPEKVGQSSNWYPTLFKMFESAATTIVSLMVLG